MGVTQKATVVAKTATKKRGRPVGSTNKTTVKPIDWEKLAKQLQAALATEMKANESLQALFDEMQSKVIIVEQVSFGKRLKFLFTGTL
jgi:translation initiation factor 1 (eIF-1/SUI1)